MQIQFGEIINNSINRSGVWLKKYSCAELQNYGGVLHSLEEKKSTLFF